MRDVLFYFDFLSPYAWLGMMQAADFAREYGVHWDLQPVVFGKLLDAHGLLGPGEVEVKRQVMARDVARCAAMLDLPFHGPPAHPFRSLEALRTACLFRREPAAMSLCVALANAAWGKGRDLSDVDVLSEVVTDCGLDATDLAARIAAPEIKADLVTRTTEAIERGIFGVPSFVLDGEVFWGQDRLPQLAARIEGRLPTSESAIVDYLARPRAVDRRASPLRDA